jgi:hypothetical protein
LRYELPVFAGGAPPTVRVFGMNPVPTKLTHEIVFGFEA